MVAALVIADGKTGGRDGFDAQREVGAIPAIQRIVKVFRLAGVERIVVVCGRDGYKAEQLVSRMNVTILHNNSDCAEMLDSVKTGLDYLRDKCAAALITHIDVPLFSVETVRALSASCGPVCIPSYEGVTGHPIMLRSELFEKISSYRGEGGLAGAVIDSGIQSQIVEVGDEGILVNINHNKGYEGLIEKHDLMEMHTDVRIRLVREKAFYGPGAHQLLQLTDETNSVLEACRKMGLSYSKGRGIIAAIEQQFGYPVIESRLGGKSGSRSRVTKEGKELMRGYEGYCAEAKEFLDELFGKYFTR